MKHTYDRPYEYQHTALIPHLNHILEPIHRPAARPRHRPRRQQCRQPRHRTRMGRPGRPVRGHTARVHGSVRPVHRPAVDHRRPGTHRNPGTLDHGHLRLRPCRTSGRHGQHRRPHRAPPTTDDRRPPLRGGVPGLRTLDNPGNADHRTRHFRCRRRSPAALRPRHDPRHVHRRGPTPHRHRHLDGRVRRRPRHRPHHRRPTARALPLGIGLPDQHPDHGRPSHRRTDAAARIPRPESGPPRPGECPAPASGRRARHLRKSRSW